MNKRQKSLVINSVTIITVTAIVVVAMINFKDWVNRSEAMRAMEYLGQRILQYRKDEGSVPPESYVDRLRNKLPGNVRLGDLKYRSLWIDADSTNDEILAYTRRVYEHSLFLNEGFVVLRLDGRVEWMERQEFEVLLARQQKPMELQFQKQPKE